MRRTMTVHTDADTHSETHVDDAHHTTITLTGPGLRLACTVCGTPMPHDIAVTDDGHAHGDGAADPHDGHVHRPDVVPTTWMEAIRIDADAETDMVSVGINVGTGGWFSIAISRQPDGAMILQLPIPATVHHAHLTPYMPNAYRIVPKS